MGVQYRSVYDDCNSRMSHSKLLRPRHYTNILRQEQIKKLSSSIYE